MSFNPRNQLMNSSSIEYDDDDDEDLEAMQREFFATPSKTTRPAATVFKVNGGPANTESGKPGTADEGPVNPPLDSSNELDTRTVSFGPNLLAEVVERSPSSSSSTASAAAPLKQQQQPATGFPQAVHRSERPVKKTSAFKKAMEQSRGEATTTNSSGPRTGSSVGPQFPSLPLTNNSNNNNSVSIADYFRSKGVSTPSANTPAPSNSTTPKLEEVDAENVATLAAMSQQELKEAQEELFSQLDPSVLAALKKRAEQRYGGAGAPKREVKFDLNPLPPASGGGHSEHSHDHSYSHRGGGHDHGHSHGGDHDHDLPSDPSLDFPPPLPPSNYPRYDLAGGQVNENFDIAPPIHVGAQQHGPEDAPGLSIADLANMARSAHPAQRAMALQTLSRIALRTHAAPPQSREPLFIQLNAAQIPASAVLAASSNNLNLAAAGLELVASIVGAVPSASVDRFRERESQWDAIELGSPHLVSAVVPTSPAQASLLVSRYRREAIVESADNNRSRSWLAEAFHGPASETDLIGALLDKSNLGKLHRALRMSLESVDPAMEPLLALRTAVCLARHSPQFTAELVELCSSGVKQLPWPCGDQSVCERVALQMRLLRLSLFHGSKTVVEQKVTDKLLAILALPMSVSGTAVSSADPDLRTEALLLLARLLPTLEETTRQSLLDILSSHPTWTSFSTHSPTSRAAQFRLSTALIVGTDPHDALGMGLAAEIAQRRVVEANLDALETCNAVSLLAIYAGRFPTGSGIGAKPGLVELGRKELGERRGWEVKAAWYELLCALRAQEVADVAIAESMEGLVKETAELVAKIQDPAGDSQVLMEELQQSSTKRWALAAWTAGRDDPRFFVPALLVATLCLPTERTYWYRALAGPVFRPLASGPIELPDLDDDLLPLPLAWPVVLLKFTSLQKHAQHAQSIAQLLDVILRVEQTVDKGEPLLEYWTRVPVAQRQGAVLTTFFMSITTGEEQEEGEEAVGEQEEEEEAPSYTDTAVSSLLLDIFKTRLFQQHIPTYDRTVTPHLLDSFLTGSFGDRVFCLYLLRTLCDRDKDWWKEFWNQVIDGAAGKWVLAFRLVKDSDEEVQAWKKDLVLPKDSADEDLTRLMKQAVVMAQKQPERSTWEDSALFVATLANVGQDV